MGTDIHAVFEAKKNGEWTGVLSTYEGGRHYQLFAVLAGVRNGVGFVGTRLGDPVVPISEPRGYPPGFQVIDTHRHPIAVECLPERRRRYAVEDAEEAGRPVSMYMGYHDHSWLSADEILDWAANAPTIPKYGVVSMATFCAWDRKSKPREHCGAVFGPGIVVKTMPEVDAGEYATDVAVHWTSDLKEELGYFLDEIARLKKEHGEVRMVFGFDS